MEVVEQDPELDHLILRSEATQTPPLFGQVINLEELSLESVSQVDITQDDASFSECKTSPASPVRLDIQPEPESARMMLNSKTFDTNSTEDFIRSIAAAPVLQRPKKSEEFPNISKDEHLTSKHTNAPTLRRPSASAGKVVPAEDDKHPMSSLKQTSPSKKEQKLTVSPEKSIRKGSPKVPLAFAIMAGEVSVEFPDTDDFHDPAVKAVCEDSDDDSSDSD
ncbi:hypothetical protein Aduo_006096 [Ancylostoma duodenale]